MHAALPIENIVQRSWYRCRTKHHTATQARMHGFSFSVVQRERTARKTHVDTPEATLATTGLTVLASICLDDGAPQP